MHLTFRNVNQAFKGLVQGFQDGSVPRVEKESRNGKVLMIEEPVTITYERPRERVLFNPARDCNPFFHVFESMWMLAGRNDVASVKEFVSTIGQFSDEGETFNGAYGYRWRSALISEDGDNGRGQRQDQLAILIDHLKHNPNSRRSVLQMWNVEDDLLKIDSSKDVCCNTAVYFSIRETRDKEEHEDSYTNPDQFLDMTVTNRSNDLIWGMLGANVVHFSFLQEYIAGCLGVDVGKYHQVTNNLHIYTETNSGWTPEKWLDAHNDPYSESKEPCSLSLLSSVDQSRFDQEVKKFVNNPEEIFTCEFLETVAKPIVKAFRAHKKKDTSTALEFCSKIQAEDWKLACSEWIERRV